MFSHIFIILCHIFSFFSPLNLLDGYENRFAYSMAFGITTSYFLFMIVNNVQAILGQWVAIVNKASFPFVSCKCNLISFTASKSSAMLQNNSLMGLFLTCK